MARQPGNTIRGVARDLGHPTKHSGHRVTQSRVDAGEASGLTIDEREELTRLRRRVRTLRPNARS